MRSFSISFFVLKVEISYVSPLLALTKFNKNINKILKVVRGYKADILKFAYTLLDIYALTDRNKKMCLNPRFVKNYVKGIGYYVPCSHCIECKIQYAVSWAYRISLEASLYKDNCMITLTYNEDNLPQGGFLSKRDLQLFLKKLRWHLADKEGRQIRFFATGEYGSKNLRPHYHLIIFNYKPKDLVYFFTNDNGDDIFLSDFISKIWNKGFVSVGSVEFNSAKYVAKYLQKNKPNLPKPFYLMSRRPAIGFPAITKEMMQSDKIYVNGKFTKIPRSFLERFVKLGYNELGFIDRIKENRLKKIAIDCFSGNNPFYFNGKRLLNIPHRIEKYKKLFGNDFFLDDRENFSKTP